MKFFLLTLMVVAGGEPLSACIRAGAVLTDGGEGQIAAGCLRPDKGLPAVVDTALDKLQPKATAMFAQQQANGQHCVYEGSTRLSMLKFEDVSIDALDGSKAKALTRFTVTAEDVMVALQVQYVVDELLGAPLVKTLVGVPVFVGATAFISDAVQARLPRSCRNPAYLYRQASDIFRQGNFEQQSDRLRLLCGDANAAKIIGIAQHGFDAQLNDSMTFAEEIFATENALLYFSTSKNTFRPFKSLAMVKVDINDLTRGIKTGNRVEKIKKVLPWVHSTGASICRKQISI